jgi:hypothetical protein
MNESSAPLHAALVLLLHLRSPPALVKHPNRQTVNRERLSMDDGLMMRQLADSPGGLELHIGVSSRERG